ncbi:MAG: hypothetical protein ACRDT0_18765 [Pseudonocardiaceae bacterium]
MPLQPRFRISGASRPFVDREGAIEVFEQEVDRVGRGPCVLNITGVGGIGKSRLLRELAARVAETHRTAALDLQVSALRQPDAALAVLRAELGRQQVRFDHFDVAYAVLWQRLHPHLKVSRRELPFVEHSQVLTEIVDGVAGVPVFGTAVALLKLADAAPSRIRGRRALSRSPVLRQLDTLSHTQLADAVTYLFAQDLRAATEGSMPYVVFVDAYEALVGEHARTGHVVLSDVWLRDLVGQLDRGLCVIASREPARWEAYDPDWADVVRVTRLDDLPMRACLELLESSGIGADREIAQASSGVPFYLNLAADTLQYSDGDSGPGVVSTEQILQRFLQHVPPEEVRLLELLSLTRTFDRGVFDAVADEYRLPGHQLVWDSLTAYSFVTPTVGEHYQLHQLMVGALRSRLRAELAADVHRTLRRHWESRVASRLTGGPRGSADEVTALREAVYHGLRSGELTGDQLLGYADRIVALGGVARITPMVDDVDGMLGTQPTTEAGGLAEAARCLRAETAYLAGTPQRPVGAPGAVGLTTAARVRLALAEAHALRVLGDTRAALQAYLAIRGSGDGRHHLVAGLWAADLHMAQGRFYDAVELTAEVRARCPADDAEMQADTARLLHLTHRFAFDFDSAGEFLEEAARWYEQASTVNGRANIQTNRAEYLAWTAPDRAVAAALDAIDQQRDVGALHEIGKSRTALALACTRLGDLDRAEREFGQACAELDRAGYRSGRARAELYRAMLLARQGRIPAMLDAVHWAVQEFEATEVYPSMILGAAVALRRLGHLTRDVQAAADRARDRIRPLCSRAELEDGIELWMGSLVGELG